MVRVRAGESAGYAVFVVKGGHASNSGILCQLSVNTWQAYNYWGGESFYGFQNVNRTNAVAKLSFDRPCYLWTFLMYELDFIRWLSGAFDADYCTNADVDADPGLLDRYRLFIGVGHDEYASTKARQGIASFLDRGGNALSLSGNTCWWRVDLEDGNRTIKCDKPAYQSKPTEIIPLLGAFFENPPNALGTLISEVPRKKLAGEFRQSLGYSVCQANHWSFAGTGLKDGEVFGEEECVVGYEADAADFNLGDYGKENLGLSWPTVLAKNRFVYTGNPSRPREDMYATFVIFRRKEGNGWVANTATTGWNEAHRVGHDWRCQQISRNLVSGMRFPLGEKDRSVHDRPPVHVSRPARGPSLGRKNRDGRTARLGN